MHSDNVRRMGRGWTIAVATFLVAAAGGSARAQVVASGAEQAAAAVEQVDSALSSGELGRALRAARSAAKAFPENPSVRIALGDALGAAAFYTEARAEYERARQLGVDTPQLEAAYAFALWSEQQTGRAEAVVSAARVRWPGNAALEEVWTGLEKERRLRSGKHATFAAGTPQAFAAAVAAKVDRGALFEFLRDDLDEEFLKSLKSGGLPTGDQFFRGLARGALRKYESQPRRFIGYDVDPGTSQRNGRTVAIVHVLAEGSIGAEQLGILSRAVDDPRLKHLVDPSLLHIMSELAPPDRTRLVELLRTRVWTSFVVFEMEIVNRSGRWKVAEASLDGGSRKLSTLLAEVARLTEQGVLGDSSSESIAYHVGQAIGALLFCFALIGVPVWVIIRIVRARRPSGLR